MNYDDLKSFILQTISALIGSLVGGFIIAIFILSIDPDTEKNLATFLFKYWTWIKTHLFIIFSIVIFIILFMILKNDIRRRFILTQCRNFWTYIVVHWKNVLLVFFLGLLILFVILISSNRKKLNKEKEKFNIFYTKIHKSKIDSLKSIIINNDKTIQSLKKDKSSLAKVKEYAATLESKLKKCEDNYKKAEEGLSATNVSLSNEIQQKDRIIANKNQKLFNLYMKDFLLADDIHKDNTITELINLNEQLFFDTLIVLIIDPNKFKRNIAAYSFRHCKNDTSIDILNGVVNIEKTAFVKYTIIETLGEIGDQSSIEQLEKISVVNDTTLAGYVKRAKEKIKQR